MWYEVPISSERLLMWAAVRGADGEEADGGEGRMRERRVEYNIVTRCRFLQLTVTSLSRPLGSHVSASAQPSLPSQDRDTTPAKVNLMVRGNGFGAQQRWPAGEKRLH